jgi:hypothetical protein
VLAPERVSGHFKSLTLHGSAIIDYIHGNFEEATVDDLKEILKPRIAEWKKVKEKDMLNQIEEAAGKKKLVAGMPGVWRTAMSGNGRLMIIENDYTYNAQHGTVDEVIYKAIEPHNKFSYTKDAVGQVMEKVLENGGDVEFVENGLLTNYQGIVLLQRY